MGAIEHFFEVLLLRPTLLTKYLIISIKRKFLCKVYCKFRFR